MIPYPYKHYEIDIDNCGIPYYYAYPLEKIKEVEGWEAKYALVNVHCFCVGIFTWKELIEKFPTAHFEDITHSTVEVKK